MMSSKRGGGRSNRASKGNYRAGVSGCRVDSIIKLGVSWEVLCEENKNKSENGAPSKQWVTQTSKPNGNRRASNNTWTGQRGGASINSNYNSASNAISPPLQRENTPEAVHEDVEDQNETGDFNGSDDDDDDEELFTDEYDSDETPKPHEERKKNKWYADFFKILDALTLEEVNEARAYHCPACRNGPGSINWYRSLPSLVTHAKTKGSKRVKIHRDFAEILEEELRIRGANVVASVELYGQWKGLKEAVKDREIVWPPMVVITNTLLGQDENAKWLGIGNEELLHYFKNYVAVKAHHSYGPKGHRGMSVLIFESSAVGYTEAERLSKHFEHQGTDRHAWEHNPIIFQAGGKRQLYGYLATKRDLDVFNQHSHGKMKLKFELVSYQEKVVNQLKQMNEDNRQLNWYKNKIVKVKRHLKALEESFGLVSQRLRKIEEENRIVRERTQRYHEQNQEEMDYQEQFFKDQLKVIQDARNAKEGHFVKLRRTKSA